LEQHIWPQEATHVSSDFVYDGTLLAAAEMLRGGITCCNDMYFHPDDAARAFDAAGLRAILGVPILDFPTPYARDGEEYLRRGLEARDRWHDHPRLTFALGPHAPYTVSDATFGRIVMFAQQLDLALQTHLHETAAEIAQSLAQFGERPLHRLARLGVTGPNFIAIHAVHMDAGDIELLAREHGHAVHCPSSNMKLASGLAPVAALMAAGINVALGTDGAASNNRLDLFEEMRLAALAAKTQTGDAAQLPAQQALRMATLNGAQALGLEDRLGSITIGKRADLVAVDLSALEALPCYDPVSHLVYVSNRRDVTHVWVDGECRLRDGQLLQLDARELASTARRWQEKLK
jgi:5-methylthioadenosine/S-adenosylhomocysteine deaminase